MLRRILIGLGGMAGSRSALDLGIHWAKLHSAQLVGIDIVDNPGVQVDEGPKHRSEAPGRAASGSPLVEWFVRQCEEAGVEYLVRVAARHSSRDPLRGSAARPDPARSAVALRVGNAGGTRRDLDQGLARLSRPVVIVPNGRSTGDSIVIAYDGSLQAARALHAFEASGLGAAHEVHVVTIDHNPAVASRIADRAVDFLSAHGILAASHPVETSFAPAEVIREKVHDTGAGLLVMGIYGQPVLREFIMGSVTRILKGCPVPVFVYQ